MQPSQTNHDAATLALLALAWALNDAPRAERLLALTGLTTNDLRARLAKHNAGEVPHTSKYGPWRLKTYIAFSDAAQAIAFERYLKSASGRAFAKKRL